jgi:hypothetical protein
MDIYHPDRIPRNPQEIPEEFRKMCWKLSQDEVQPRFTSQNDIVNFLVKDLDSRERSVVKAYFDSLFALNLSDRELLRVWRHAGSDWLVSGEEGVVKEYFGMISKALDH